MSHDVPAVEALAASGFTVDRAASAGRNTAELVGRRPILDATLEEVQAGRM